MKSKHSTPGSLVMTTNYCCRTLHVVSSCCRRNNLLTSKNIFLLAGLLFLFVSSINKSVAQATKLSTIQGNFQLDGDLYTKNFQFPDSCPPKAQPTAGQIAIADDWFPGPGSPPAMLCHNCGPNGTPIANYGIGVIDTTGA